MTTVETVSAPLFDETLRTPILFQAFLQYMEDHVAAENFLFINAVILLHDAASAHGPGPYIPTAEVRRIISQFVCDGAPAEINISAGTRALVTKAFLTPDSGVGSYSYDEYSSSSSDDEYDSFSTDGRLSLEQLQPVMDEMRLLTMPHFRAWIATGAWKEVINAGLCALRPSEAPSAKEVLTTPILCSMFGTYLREHIDDNDEEDSEKEQLLMKVQFLEEAAIYCSANPLGKNGPGLPELRKTVDDDSKKDGKEATDKDSSSEKKILEQRAKEICKKHKHILGTSQKGVSFRISIFTHVESTVSFVSSTAVFKKWLETREWGAAGFTTSEKLHQTRAVLTNSCSPLVTPSLAAALCRGLKNLSPDDAASADFLFLPTTGVIAKRNPAQRMLYSWGDCVYDLLSLSNAQKEFCFLVDAIAFHKRFAAVATTASSHKGLIARMNDIAREIYKRYFGETSKGPAALIFDAVSGGNNSSLATPRGGSPSSMPMTPVLTPSMLPSFSSGPGIPYCDLSGNYTFNLMNIDKATLQEIRSVFDGRLFKGGKVTPEIFTKAAQQIYFNAKNTWYKDLVQLPVWTQHEYDNTCSEASDIEMYLNPPFLAGQYKYTDIRPDDVMENSALRKKFFSELPLDEVIHLVGLVRVIDEMERKDSLTPNDIKKVSKVVARLNDDYPLISAQLNMIETNMRGMRRISNRCLTYMKETVMRFLFIRFFAQWKESFDPSSVSWTQYTGRTRFSGISFLSHIENICNLYPDSIETLMNPYSGELRMQNISSGHSSDSDSEKKKPQGSKSKEKERKVKEDREKSRTGPKDMITLNKKKKKDSSHAQDGKSEESELDTPKPPALELLDFVEKPPEGKDKGTGIQVNVPGSPKNPSIRPRSVSSATVEKEVPTRSGTLDSPLENPAKKSFSVAPSPMMEGKKKATRSKADDYFVTSDSESDTESGRTTLSGSSSKRNTGTKKSFLFARVNHRSNSFMSKSSESSGTPSSPDSPVVLSGQVSSKKLPTPDFDDILQSRYLRKLFTEYIKGSSLSPEKRNLWYAFAGFYNDYSGLDSIESVSQQKSMTREATEIINQYGEEWPEKTILLQHINNGRSVTPLFFKKVEKRLFGEEYDVFIVTYSSVWSS